MTKSQARNTENKHNHWREQSSRHCQSSRDFYEHDFCLAACFHSLFTTFFFSSFFLSSLFSFPNFIFCRKSEQGKLSNYFRRSSILCCHWLFSRCFSVLANCHTSRLYLLLWRTGCKEVGNLLENTKCPKYWKWQGSRYCQLFKDFWIWLLSACLSLFFLICVVVLKNKVVREPQPCPFSVTSVCSPPASSVNEALKANRCLPTASSAISSGSTRRCCSPVSSNWAKSFSKTCKQARCVQISLQLME